jgi:hypothetical protein
MQNLRIAALILMTPGVPESSSSNKKRFVSGVALTNEIFIKCEAPFATLLQRAFFLSPPLNVCKISLLCSAALPKVSREAGRRRGDRNLAAARNISLKCLPR